MEDKFTKIPFERILRIEAIVTLFYLEISKNFHYSGESHDFWEMVYVDKGEVVCTASERSFVLGSGEMIFHRPNEYHNLAGNGSVAPNVSILSFVCRSRAMRHFEGKIFRLDSQEKALLSLLFSEGLSCFRSDRVNDPLHTRMESVPDAPLGGSQAVESLLTYFLIRLARHTDVLPKKSRESFRIDGLAVPPGVSQIVEILSEHLYSRVAVSQIAERLGRSESGVKQMFARHFGEGIIHYFNRMKVSEAKRLIREGRGNFAEISDLLSFESPQYFSKCFKKYTGMTPSQYKDSIRS